MFAPELKQAARLVLESAARSSRAPVVESFGEISSRAVFVVRSGGADMLAAFLVRLAAIDPGAEVFVLGRRGDRDLLPQLWRGRWTCHEVEGDEPFNWRTVGADDHIVEAARRCGPHVFLMRNASASGYDNVIEILRHLRSDESFFGCMPGGTLVRFDPAALDTLLASARLRDALVEWAARAESDSVR
jgi:hypothetical protein